MLNSWQSSNEEENNQFLLEWAEQRAFLLPKCPNILLNTDICLPPACCSQCLPTDQECLCLSLPTLFPHRTHITSFPSWQLQRYHYESTVQAPRTTSHLLPLPHLQGQNELVAPLSCGSANSTIATIPDPHPFLTLAAPPIALLHHI